MREDGTKVSKGSRRGRHDRFSPSIPDLTGLGPDAERDGAIIALGTVHRWSPARLSGLFGISESQVYRVLADWDAEHGGDD